MKIEASDLMTARAGRNFEVRHYVAKMPKILQVSCKLARISRKFLVVH